MQANECLLVKYCSLASLQITSLIFALLVGDVVKISLTSQVENTIKVIDHGV